MNYAITELGNGPWCDTIEAASIDDAFARVKEDLAACNPRDYDDTYEAGDKLPTVDVSVREIETDEEITRTLTVGL